MKKTSTVVNDHVLAGPALLIAQVLIAFGMFVGLIMETFKGLKQYPLIETREARTEETRKMAVKASGKISGNLPVREFRS